MENCLFFNRKLAYFQNKILPFKSFSSFYDLESVIFMASTQEKTFLKLNIPDF